MASPKGAPGQQHKNFLVGISSLAFLLVTLGIGVAVIGKPTGYESQAKAPSWRHPNNLPLTNKPKLSCVVDGKLCRQDPNCCKQRCVKPTNTNGGEVGVCYNAKTGKKLPPLAFCTKNSQCQSGICLRQAKRSREVLAGIGRCSSRSERLPTSGGRPQSTSTKAPGSGLERCKNDADVQKQCTDWCCERWDYLNGQPCCGSWITDDDGNNVCQESGKWCCGDWICP